MESPDFDQIAWKLKTALDDHPQLVQSDHRIIAEALRLIWNARGAADIKTFDTAVAKQLETREVQRTDLDLNAVVRAIHALDR